MPLSEKARIEVYIPDQPSETYQNLITAFEQEFTHTFGGCSTNDSEQFVTPDNTIASRRHALVCSV